MRTIAKDLTAVSRITIEAPASKVWEALITPPMIKQYLHGTDVETDWKVGSPILFRGVWKGKSYQDKGIIQSIVRERLLEYSFWSSLAGKEDQPENYIVVTYKLEPKENQTKLTVLADDPNADETTREHMEQNWSMVLKSLKEMLEAR